MTAAPTDRIEKTGCGRCGGSGRYSYNQMHGSRCFGCGGAGKVLTPRGTVAQRFLEDLRSKRADAFVAGELIQHDIVSPFATAKTWANVVSVEPTVMKTVVNGVPSETPMVTLVLSGKTGTTRVTTNPGTMMRKGFDGETKQAQLREAIAFQATLDGKGRPLSAAA